MQVPDTQLHVSKDSTPGDDILEVTLPVTFGETGNFITRFCTFEVADRPMGHPIILGQSQLAVLSASIDHMNRQITMPGLKGAITVPEYVPRQARERAHMHDQNVVLTAPHSQATPTLGAPSSKEQRRSLARYFRTYYLAQERAQLPYQS